MIDTLKVAELVSAFLPGWRFNSIKSSPSEWRPIAAISCDKTGDVFHMASDWRNDQRLQIYGKHSETRITVAKSRCPEAIAGDIRRRFLPGYLKDVEAHKNDSARRRSQAEAYAHKLALFESVFGYKGRQNYNGGEIYYDRASVNFMYDDSIEIGFRVNLDDAVRLAYFAKSLEE